MNAVATAKALGGPAVLGKGGSSEVAFVHLVEMGLPARALDRLATLGDLTPGEMSQIIPRRTLTHLKRRRRLTPEQSDRVARAAGAFVVAHEVFVDRAKANRWMRQTNRALEGETPLSLLRTGSGTSLVEAVLIRLAAGVYS
jgi:putative toxin-antitoxin system antitoxin component (TIGR02293 family)